MEAALLMDVVTSTMEMNDEHENRTAQDHTDSLVLMTHIDTSRLWYVVACGAGEDAQKAEGGDVNVSWIILIPTFSFFMFLRSIISVACCVKAKTMGKPMVALATRRARSLGKWLPRKGFSSAPRTPQPRARQVSHARRTGEGWGEDLLV